MEFKVIGSSSAGNCYILSDGEDRIMIEAGLPWKRVQQALNFDTQGIRFCLCSHLHQDHSRYVDVIMSAGIDVYAPPAGFMHHRFHPLDKYTFVVDDWRFRAFPVRHDIECYGFLIAKGSERILYLTDCLYSPFRFADLTMILIGVNYSKDTISEDIDSAHRKHIIQDHMSLETAKELLKANDLSKVREMHLLHLSRDNSNADLFQREIQSLTGKPVFVAKE